MANLGYVSSFNINGNELSLKDAALTEIVEEIIEAIGANNGDISDRINDLHNRAFDNVIEVEGDFYQDMRDSSFNSINDGLYKIKYVTTSGNGDNETKTLNNSAILIADGLTQYLYVNGRIFYCSKGSSANAPWPPAWDERYVSNAGVTSVNGQTGAVTITHPVTSVNGQTGAVTVNVPVTSVNEQTGAVNITIPTKTSDLTNDSNFTTLSEVQTEIVGAAPEQLNTLAELADALNDDQNFASTVTNLIGQKYTKPSTGIPASDLADGVIPDVPVISVNGMTGAVVIPEGGVTSFNGATGAITYTAPVTSVNGMTGAVTIDAGVTSFNGATGAITYTAPVTSVNGMTGAVNITAIQGINVHDISLTPDANNIIDIGDYTFDDVIEIMGDDESQLDDIITPGIYKVIYKENIAENRSIITVKTSILYVRTQTGYSDGGPYTYLQQIEYFGDIRYRSQIVYIKSINWSEWTTILVGTIITQSNISNFEEDPIFSNSPAYSITSTDITNWNSAYTNGHTHSNKSVLDSISNTDIAYWNNKLSTAPVTSVNGQTGAVTITETQLSKGTATGSGNAVTDINVSNHQITLVKGATYATQSDIDTSIAALVDSAPGTLDTLNELAAALGDDPNFATTIAGQIGAKYTKPSTGIPSTDLANDVQTNLTLASTALQSFTETDPTVPSHVKNITSQDITNWNNKLSTAPVTSVNGQTGTVSLALGDTNVIETIKVNNTSLTPVSKAVNITVPTKVSDLTNDSNFTSNAGTITGITMNGVSKGTNGVVDLGTVLTEHQDISGKVDKVTGMGLSSNDYTTTEKNKLAGINIGSLDSLTTTELNSIFS